MPPNTCLPDETATPREHDVSLTWAAPNLDAYCESWIGSLKRECLSHFICFGQTHLDYVLREYVDYYNTVRPHSAIGNAPLAPHEPIRDGPIRRASRLGGLLNHYYREAA